MLTRRRLFLTAASLLALAATGLPQAGHAQSASAATQFVERTGQLLIGVVNGDAPTEQKRQQLVSVIDQRVDVNAIAQFCLGAYWRRATPAEQQDYISLFHRVLVNNITGRLGEFRGVTFAPGRAAAQGADVAVSSTVTRPGNAPNRVQWIVSTASGQPKIVDVVAEGTSLRLTQRQDYNSYLSRNGGSIAAFLEALHRQAAAAG